MGEYTAFSNETYKFINKDNCARIIENIQNLLFKNYFEIIDEDLAFKKMLNLLEEELNNAYALRNETYNIKNLIEEFIKKLSEISRILKEDAYFFYESDPACLDINEVIITYPGFFAIIVYRISNILYKLNVPYLPRIFSEYAHMKTGIDIHPGATIGERFFIDHGTGIVIGETTIIGKNVKIYQGVTLGALSLKDGKKLKGERRHPIIEDNVTIYSNASILGKDTIIGKNCVIACNAFVTKSTEPNMVVR